MKHNISLETICDTNHWLREKLLGQICCQKSPIEPNCFPDIYLTTPKNFLGIAGLTASNHPPPPSPRIGPSHGKLLKIHICLHQILNFLCLFTLLHSVRSPRGLCSNWWTLEGTDCCPLFSVKTFPKTRA